MSNLWFNLRILVWHIQIYRGDLFRAELSCNPWWWRRELLWRPVQLYACALGAAWRHRGETHWKPVAMKG